MNAHSASSGATPSILTPEGIVAYTDTLDCIHCGLCLRTCPTYELTGVESSSPRGRIHLIRSAFEGRIDPGPGYAEELSFCLMCRRCESVCPAGVHFGALMEHARDAQVKRVPPTLFVRVLRHVGLRWLLPSRTLLRVVGALARFGEWSGARALVRQLLGKLGAFLDHAPTVPPLAEQRPLPAASAPPAGGFLRGTVVLLEGCVAPLLTGRSNRATFDSLRALGFDVRVPRAIVCCGSLHAHNGDWEGARGLARRAIDAFESAAPADAPVVTNSAGCGSHLRELEGLFETDDPWRVRAARLRARVRDYSQVVAGPLEELRPRAATAEAVAYDDPCHLCHGQGVRSEPRRVLAALDGLNVRLLDDPEACCGAAGLYSLSRPADSRDIFAPRLAAFERSGATVLVTANPGCLLQWQSGLAPRGARAVHLAELVDDALRASAL